MPRGPYTIRARDDLGNDGPMVFGEHLTLDEMRARLRDADGSVQLVDGAFEDAAVK